MTSAATFLYFGYGSNLLRKRLSLQNKTAVFVTTAKLDGYKLEFDYPSTSWHGASATVTPCAGEHVWGVVWRMNQSDIPNIDNQEGVSQGIYRPFDVNVLSKDNEMLQCRSYHLLKVGYPERRPSPHYLEVIVRGAMENALPQYYIDKLKSIEHNGYYGSVEVFNKLGITIENCIQRTVE